MSQRNKYVNSNLNGVLSSQKPGTGYSQPYSQPARYGSGFVSLGAPKKARLPASTSASKLAVPRPVNLPSLRKENAGNDPNTQIVPSGSGSSWQKVEEQAPPPADPRQSALTVGSTWASEKSRESGWQPPAPQIQTLPPPRAGARRLNPHEYPSLSAAAVARQQHLPKQRVPSVSDSQGLASWDEDERRLPLAPPSQSSVPDRGVEEERGFRAPWEDRPDRAVPEGYGARGFEEDRWVSGNGIRGAPPPPARPPFARPPGSADRFGSFDRFGGGGSAVEFPPFADDVALFPPPPMPTRAPPPPPPPRTEVPADHNADGKDDLAGDPERAAYLAELERVAQELEKRKQEPKEVAPEEVVSEEEAAPAPEPVPPPQEPSGPLTLAQVAAANVTEADVPPAEAPLPVNAKLARRQRELAEEEAERKRKEAAAAKLKALEDAIAAREAEKRAMEELAAKQAEEEAAEAAARAVRKAAELAAAEEEEETAEAEMAALKVGENEAAAGKQTEGATPRAPVERDLEGSMHGSSIDVQASSSVAQDALSDEDRDVSVVSTITEGTSMSVPNPWKKPSLPNGTPDTWSDKDVPVTAVSTGAKLVAQPAEQGQQQRSRDKKAVAEMLKQPVHKREAEAAVSNGLESKGSTVVHANGTTQAPAESAPTPPAVVQKGPPVSWRKILAGDDGPSTPPAKEPIQDDREAKPAENVRGTRGRGRARADRDGQHSREAAAGNLGEPASRGRGRGRGRGDRAPRIAQPARRTVAEPSSPEATAVVADVAPAQEPAEPGKRIRQRSDNARGRGGRDGAVPVRGRGRNPKPASRAAAAQPVAAPAPPPTPAPAPQARAEATPTPALAPVELPSVAPIAPPPPPAPTAQDIAPEKSQQPAAAPAGILGSVPPGLGWDATLSKPPGLSGWGTSIVAEDAGLMAIDSKRSADSMSPFAPSLDPIAVKSPIHEASDPPIERPKSAAGIGAVSRPRSSGGSNSAANSLGVDVLPNGMPALPADLSLDGPTNAQADTRSQPFGGSSHSSIGPAAFPGVLFSLPSQQGSSMWQQFSQPRPSTTQQVQPQQGAPQPSTIHPQTAYDLNAAKQAFYKAGGDQAFSASYSSASTSSQFGAFSTAQFGQGMQPSLQFGQLQTAFGSAPFVPTGKQPDWSTGAVGKQPYWSTGPLNTSSAGASAFPRAGGIESVLPNITSSYSGHQPMSDASSRSSGLPHSNGAIDTLQQALPEETRLPTDLILKPNSAASAVLQDTAAALPDDVFTPEDVRASMDPSVNQANARGSMSGGRRGGNNRGRMGGMPRGGPGGRGAYANRGRGREPQPNMDGHGIADAGMNDNNNQRRREVAPAPAQPRGGAHGRRHPSSNEGLAGPEGPRSWEGSQGGGRDSGRGGRGNGARGRGNRGGARGGRMEGQAPITTWVPLQAST